MALFGTTINSNTSVGIELDPGAGKLTINCPMFLPNSQQWINNSTSPFTLNGNVSGPGSLTLTGSGVLTMTGVYTSGPLYVNGGTLALNAENIIENSGGVTITNATVQTGYYDPFYYPPSGVPPITINSGGLLTQTAPDNVNLGAVMLNGGTLSSNGFFDSFYGSYFLQPGGFTVTGSATSTISALAITSAGPQTFNVAAGSTLNVTGYFSKLYGNFGLTKTGPGTMILSGPNTYTGDTVVDGGTLQITSGSVVSPNQYVGYSGTGSVVQSGGSNSPSSGLYLGYNSGSYGSCTLTGSGLLAAATENIGFAGSGVFTQSGGTNLVSLKLIIGNLSSSGGTYNLNAGSLSTGDEYVGWNANGVVNHSGGAATASDALWVGYTYSGSYNFNGNGLISTPSEYIGYSAAGSFNHSSGTNSVTAALYLGYNAGSSGTYNLNGGLLSATSSLGKRT